MPAPECLTAALLPEATPCALSMRMQEDLLVCCSEHEFESFVLPWTPAPFSTQGCWRILWNAEPRVRGPWLALPALRLVDGAEPHRTV